MVFTLPKNCTLCLVKSTSEDLSLSLVCRVTKIHRFVFLDVESAKYMVLKQKVQGHIEELSHHIKASFGVAGSRVSGLFVSTQHSCTDSN